MDNTGRHLWDRSRSFFAATERIAGFELPTVTKSKFSPFYAAINCTPRPPILERLTVEGGARQDWLQPLINAVGYVQEGLAASYYHLGNIESMEREIIDVALASLGELKIPMHAGVGGGNTRKLDFEYQAFVSALRRTMDYFAVSVGAFFQHPAHRIKHLSRSIDRAEPIELRKRVQVRLIESLQNLSGLLSNGTDKSVRDLLAHYQAVAAGVVNITAGPFGTFIGIAGGGEKMELGIPEYIKQLLDTGAAIEPSRQKEGNIEFSRLAPVLQNQVSRVEGMIFGIYEEIGLTSVL